MNNHDIAWHYTTGVHFQRIVEDGFLRPATAGITANEKPILWFSSNPVWEQTANKMIGAPDGSVRPGTKEDTRAVGGGLVRFGIEKRKLHPWPKIGRKARMPREVAKSLEKAARNQGANPAEWYGTTRTIPVDEVVAIEVETESGWVSGEVPK